MLFSVSCETAPKFTLSLEEACELLGILPGSDLAHVEASFRARVKEVHPDVTTAKADAADQLMRLIEARAVLRRQARNIAGEMVLASTGPSNATPEDVSPQQTAKESTVASPSAEDAEDSLPASHPTRLVRDFLNAHRIVAGFDGCFHPADGSRMAKHNGEIDSVLMQPEVNQESILDDLLLECKASGVKLAAGDAYRALNQILRKARQDRLAEVMKPLLTTLSADDQARAGTEWPAVATLFDEDTHFVCAVLQHFIWQVQQRILRRPVFHHLMPIVFGQAQGSGKTTFVQHFLGPLHELALGPVLLSDYADKRSADIFRYPVLFIDDVGKLRPELVAELKSTMTGAHLPRRILGTSKSRKITQVSTLIGTANTPIHELVFDTTGHRRFVQLQFKNGEAAKGGDPAVWKTVAALNYKLLWQSVDAFGPPPILPFIGRIGGTIDVTPIDPLLQWLRTLDLNSEAIRRISVREGIRAQGLYELFCVETGASTSLSRFGIDMRRLGTHPDMPFGPKLKLLQGYIYPVKRKV